MVELKGRVTGARGGWRQGKDKLKILMIK